MKLPGHFGLLEGVAACGVERAVDGYAVEGGRLSIRTRAEQTKTDLRSF